MHEALAAMLFDLMRQAQKGGAPSGALMLEVQRARRDLRHADDALRRLHNAIVARAEEEEALDAERPAGEGGPFAQYR